VDTQYAACACSPLGKLWRTSAPYAPGGTPQWTTYAYDGSGRTVSVTAPDGSVTRTEYLSYYGGTFSNFVRVTDPAGKWKIQQVDAMGNLVNVYEPNPAGGADLVTVYTYNGLGQMTDVSMTRSTGTQTRHFVYTGKDLTSATNPENGTVTYQYDASHRVTKRTDALGQETHYLYDSYGRLSQVEHWVWVTHTQYGRDPWQQLDELPRQRVTYHYDSNPLDGTYSQYTQGRLAAVEFSEENVGMGFTYQYSYNQAGRVTAQRMTYGDMDPFDANYTWDTEGRMTGINYGPSYTLQYDGNGRLSGMQDTTNGNTVATASYDSGSGLMTGLSYFGFAETRTFNSLMQMTRQTVTNVGTTVMDMQYNFAAGANNGRITSSVDNMNSETVNYAYDALNRLANATAGTWGQGFGYDGFGNLTAKTALLGSVPVLSVSFDAATNHQTGVSYDANGNVMGYLTAYDVENRMIGGYSYDHA